MPYYLTKKEIEDQADEIKLEFEKLLAHPRMAVKHAKQWDFFRHCFDVLMGRREAAFSYDRVNVTFYKYEVTRKLSAYYAGKSSQNARFVFELKHERHKDKCFGEESFYPSACEYMLLVSRPRLGIGTHQELRDIVYRVVDDAIHAEFAMYKNLPEVEPKLLEGCFVMNGPAAQRIMQIVCRHQQRNEIISNDDGNPSTRALRSLTIISSSEDLIRVRTTEYWHLHWWSTVEQTYQARAYRGINRQQYFLVKLGERWLVFDNPYHSPRE